MKSKKFWIGLIVVVSLWMGISDLNEFQSVTVPQLESQRKGAETTLAQRQAELRKLQNFAQNIETVKQELREMNLQMEAALESMPRTFNLSELLRKLNLIAQNSNVELYSFKPKKNQEDAVPGQFFSTLSIDFSLKGSFTQTLVFLDQVSRLKRIVNVEGLKIKRRATDKQPGRGGVVLADTEATIQAFRFRE